MAQRDHYEVLGVERGAAPAEIAAAYERLRDGPEAARAHRAYAVLGDAERRARYDRFGFGAADGRPRPPPQGPPDFDAMFAGETVTPAEFERLAAALARAAAQRRIDQATLARLHRGFVARSEDGAMWTLALKSRRWARRGVEGWETGAVPPPRLTLPAAIRREIAGLAPAPAEVKAETTPQPAAPAAPSSAVARGRACLERIDYDGAVAAFGEAIAADPRQAEAWIGRGRAHVGRRAFGKALEDHRQAVDLAPGLAEARVALGETWMWFDDYGQSIAAFEEALRLDPEHAVARQGLKKAREARRGRFTARIVVAVIGAAAILWWFRDELFSLGGGR